MKKINKMKTVKLNRMMKALLKLKMSLEIKKSTIQMKFLNLSTKKSRKKQKEKHKNYQSKWFLQRKESKENLWSNKD